jgi:peroxiredoxin
VSAAVKLHVAPGEPLPSIGLRATDGYLLNLRSWVGRMPAAILFFAGPTAEGPARLLGDTLARALAAALPELQAAGIGTAGVTCDSEEQQKAYVAEHDLPFLLLSDERRSAAEALGIGLSGAEGNWNVATPLLVAVDEAGVVRELFIDPDPRLIGAMAISTFREPIPS